MSFSHWLGGESRTLIYPFNNRELMIDGIPNQPLYFLPKGHYGKRLRMGFPKWWDTDCWLVVWLPFFIFPYIGNVIIPIDFHIFQRGGPTTNQIVNDDK